MSQIVDRLKAKMDFLVKAFPDHRNGRKLMGSQEVFQMMFKGIIGKKSQPPDDREQQRQHEQREFEGEAQAMRCERRISAEKTWLSSMLHTDLSQPKLMNTTHSKLFQCDFQG
ncbi:MAG: hypothetical protein R3F44_18185 [Candidatus Competibacteraceae bacterium]